MKYGEGRNFTGRCRKVGKQELHHKNVALFPEGNLLWLVPPIMEKLLPVGESVVKTMLGWEHKIQNNHIDLNWRLRV